MSTFVVPIGWPAVILASVTDRTGKPGPRLFSSGQMNAPGACQRHAQLRIQ
jgi:hypothetical protein